MLLLRLVGSQIQLEVLVIKHLVVVHLDIQCPQMVVGKILIVVIRVHLGIHWEELNVMLTIIYMLILMQQSLVGMNMVEVVRVN